MARHRKQLWLAVLAAFGLTLSAFGATGDWNGVAFTEWNGVEVTAFNGTSISTAGGGGGGGIVIDAGDDDIDGGVTTASFSIVTTQTLTNACFIIAGHYYRSAGAITSITCSVDGTAGLTATTANNGLDDYDLGGGNHTGFFLTRVLFSSKAAGTYTVSITLDEQVNDIAWGALALGGVDQTTPLETLTGFTGGANTAATATISSATGELVFAVFGHNTDMSSAGSGDTIRFDANAAGGYMYVEGITSPGDTSVTVSGTLATSQLWGGIICVVNPAP